MDANVPLTALAGAVFSILLGSLFAAAETAVTALSSARLGALLEQATGAKRRAYERIQRSEATMRARYLLGRIVCVAIGAVLLHVAFQPTLPHAAPYVALVATVLLSGVLHEITTTLARHHADTAAAAAARYLWPLEIAMLPLATPLGWIGARIGERRTSIRPDPRVTEAEMEIMVDEVERSGLFGREPAEMIRNVLEFADLTTRDVMVPRDRVDAIELSTPLEKVLELVSVSGHSRYPVYKEQLDNVVGLLYAKDLFRVLEEHRLKRTSLREIIRTPAKFVAESQPLSSLLREMRGRRQHLAIVVDELGGVSGIVTLEDVLEEIVGDIRDEHDEATIQDLGDGRLVADGGVSMSDLSAYLGTELPDDGEYDSLGGMLTDHVGRVPQAGTTVSRYGLRFVVRDADERHVGKVEIIRPTPARRAAAAMRSPA